MSATYLRDPSRFAEHLKSAIVQHGITVSRMADMADIPTATAYRWLRGAPIPLRGARKIVTALDQRFPDPAGFRDLYAFIDEAATDDRLREEFRRRNIPVRRAMDAVHAARAEREHDSEV